MRVLSHKFNSRCVHSHEFNSCCVHSHPCIHACPFVFRTSAVRRSDLHVSCVAVRTRARCHVLSYCRTCASCAAALQMRTATANSPTSTHAGTRRVRSTAMHARSSVGCAWAASEAGTAVRRQTALLHRYAYEEFRGPRMGGFGGRHCR